MNPALKLYGLFCAAMIAVMAAWLLPDSRPPETFGLLLQPSCAHLSAAATDRMPCVNAR